MSARARPGSALMAALAVGVGLAGSCRTLPRGATGTIPRLPGVAVLPNLEALAPPPTIRVGVLTDAQRVSIGADQGLVVRLDEARTLSLQRATFVSAVPAGTDRRFRVQVASLADVAAARDTAARTRSLAGMEPTVTWNPETGTHQVRVGEFATREAAQALAGRLEEAGLGGPWVVEEPAAAPAARLRLLETGDELTLATLVPARADDVVYADSTPYRGYMQVRPGEGGTVIAINVLNLEDYLKGVVPNELSPVVFPQIEALKAQAVAARTYALRNRGQFEAKGYDICATPTCQVYRGRASEHELATQAVDETRGIAASHNGALINALYTSTCGGHTEDVENIFEGEAEPAPYLRGVPCIHEREFRTTLRTAAAPLAVAGDERLARDAALLAALGVLEPALVSGPGLAAPASDEELRGWVERLVAALQRQACPGAANGALTRRGTFFRHLVGSLCWEDRAQRLLAPGDADYLLRVEDRDALSTGELLPAALLVQEGVLPLFPDNTVRPEAPLTRGQAVALMAAAALRAGPPAYRTAVFREAPAGELIAEVGEERLAHPIDREVRLFRALDGAFLSASELELLSGDRIRFVVKDGRVVLLEAEQTRLGAAGDRSSRVYRWEVRMTPDEVAKSVAARYGTVGQVRDLRPVRLGVSGRVIEMAVQGSEGELVLKGLKVRWGLGLRENLFVVDRERDASGAVKRFIFTGKGWGHGVGLCQVGAFGLAQAGADYETILRHFYRGVRLGGS